MSGANDKAIACAIAQIRWSLLLIEGKSASLDDYSRDALFNALIDTAKAIDTASEQARIMFRANMRIEATE